VGDIGLKLSIRGLPVALAAVALAAASGCLVAAPEPPRTISLYHIHTKETLSIVYKKDGKHIPEAMQKIDWIMRDWRKNEAIKMDPAAIDILWEIHTELGSKEPIHIICGYRSSGTNAMLRRTVGGQAKNSQHISGKAIDAYFPDVQPKYARYAGLVREKGGVGYYPTSALPFVHIDTGRVRHWPKIGHDELALLFPGDRSKHVPLGGALGPGDHKRALERQKDLATQVLAYNDLRAQPRLPTLVAAAGLPVPPAPKRAARPAPAAPARAPLPIVVAALGPTLAPQSPAAEPQKPAPKPALRPAPQLVGAPRLVERPSRFTPAPSAADRTKLDSLVRLAALEPPSPRLVAQPAPAPRPAKAAPSPAHGPEAQPQPAVEGWSTTTIEAELAQGSIDMGGWGERLQWVQAPEYDEDHPEELSYQPFPVGPMLTASASPDDPALTELVHPDIARTLEVLDEDGSIQPMRLRPRQQIAALIWSQQFRGEAVRLSSLDADASAEAAPAGLANRTVRTTQR
jgi:uncharacterized protein YcbK (DUF882 family)